MRPIVLLIGVLVLATQTDGQPRPPIIDMHLHAQSLSFKPGLDAAEAFGPVFGPRVLGIPTPSSTEAIQAETLAALDRFNIVLAVVGGGRSNLYKEARPGRILTGPDPSGQGTSPDELRPLFLSGRYDVFAEFMPQYRGMAPNDPSLAGYFALAEELDVPVGIHMGIGPPGYAQRGSGSYRMATRCTSRTCWRGTGGSACTSCTPAGRSRARWSRSCTRFRTCTWNSA